jgi:hypothetical protein
MSDPKYSGNDVDRQVSAPKLAYQAPELREHGTVEELTQGAGTLPSDTDDFPPYSDPTPPVS